MTFQRSGCSADHRSQEGKEQWSKSAVPIRAVDPKAMGRAVLVATSKFHHPVHAAEWGDPAIDAVYEEVWQLVMDGLRAEKRSV